MNSNDYVHCCVIGCHGNFIVAFGLNKIVSCEGLLRGGELKYFWNIYISMIMQLNFVYIMFLHVYDLSFDLWNIYGKDPRFNIVWTDTWEHTGNWQKRRKQTPEHLAQCRWFTINRGTLIVEGFLNIYIFWIWCAIFMTWAFQLLSTTILSQQ